MLALRAGLLAILAGGLLALGSLSSGCTAVKRIPDDRETGTAYLRLDVEPTTTKIFVDSHYRGIVAGWVQQTVPVASGQRMVELRADGYITRRFDIDFDPGEQVTLEVDMERTLDEMH